MRNLYAIVYISKALVPFDQEQLKKLSHNSESANSQVDVTGYLYYDSGYFLQYLEGPKENVCAIMDRIKKDPRHEMDQIKEKAELDSRRFPNWHMHQLQRNALIEIRMEKVLMEFMMMMRKDFILISQRAEDNIWRVIDRVASYQSVLA